MMQLLNDHPYRPSSSSSSLDVRSIICDNNGIIIAETCYRCMFCGKIFNTINCMQSHYHYEHYEDEIYVKEFDNDDQQQQRLKNLRKRPLIDYDQDDYDDSTNVSVNDNDKNEDYFENNLNDLLSMQLFENQEVNGEQESTKSSPIIHNQNTRNGGIVTCEVCGLTKYYSHISRRYGVFSCESCAKFFYRYCQKPVQYKCSNNGDCSLKIDSPGARCKSCLLNACLKKYILDPKKHANIFNKHLTNNDNDKDLTATIDTNNDINNNNNDYSLTSMNDDKQQFGVAKSSTTLLNLNKKFKNSKPDSSSSSSSPSSMKKKSDQSKFRRTACRVCEGCLQEDCGTCLYCLDKPKFGGNDVKKQKCMKRRCFFLKPISE